MPLRISERYLREQIRSLCAVLGWRMEFTQYSLRSPKGFPDLVLLRPPRLIFAELKSETGKTTVERDEWLGQLRELDGVEVIYGGPSTSSASRRCSGDGAAGAGSFRSRRGVPERASRCLVKNSQRNPHDAPQAGDA